MSNTQTPQGVVVQDEAYFERFSDDCLAFFVWSLMDDYLDVLFEQEHLKENIHEAACSFSTASIAMRVLTRRLIGMEPAIAKSRVNQMMMISYGLAKPDGEALQ